MNRFYFLALFSVISFLILSCQNEIVKPEVEYLEFDRSSITYEKDVFVGDSITISLPVLYSGNKSELEFTSSIGTIQSGVFTFVPDSGLMGWHTVHLNVKDTKGKGDYFLLNFNVSPFVLSFTDSLISYPKVLKNNDTLIVPLHLEYSGDRSELTYKSSNGTVMDSTFSLVVDNADSGYQQIAITVLGDKGISDSLQLSYYILPNGEMIEVGNTWVFNQIYESHRSRRITYEVKKERVNTVTKSNDEIVINTLSELKRHVFQWNYENNGIDTIVWDSVITDSAEYNVSIDTSNVYDGESFIKAKLVNDFSFRVFQRDSTEYLGDNPYKEITEYFKESEDSIYSSFPITLTYFYYEYTPSQDYLRDSYRSFIVPGLGVVERETSSYQMDGNSSSFLKRLIRSNDTEILDFFSLDSLLSEI